METIFTLAGIQSTPEDFVRWLEPVMRDLGLRAVFREHVEEEDRQSYYRGNPAENPQKPAIEPAIEPAKPLKH